MAGRFRYLIGLLIVAAMLGARGETPAPEVQHLEFTVFSAQPVKGLMYRAQVTAASIPLEFYPTARSPRYAYQGPARICFWNGEAGSIAAEITVPPGITSALFLFAPEGSLAGSTRYRVQVLDDGWRHHTSGGLRIVNYSGLDLSGTVNRKQVMLAAGAEITQRAGGSADIKLRTRFKDQSFQAYAETIPVGESGRALLMLLPPYRTGALEVQSRLLLDTPALSGRDKSGAR